MTKRLPETEDSRLFRQFLCDVMSYPKVGLDQSDVWKHAEKLAVLCVRKRALFGYAPGSDELKAIDVQCSDLTLSILDTKDPAQKPLADAFRILQNNRHKCSRQNESWFQHVTLLTTADTEMFLASTKFLPMANLIRAKLPDVAESTLSEVDQVCGGLCSSDIVTYITSVVGGTLVPTMDVHELHLA